MRCLLGLVAIIVLAGVSPLTAHDSPLAPPDKAGADKQSILWSKLQERMAEINQGLDGVLGVAILDLSSGHKFLLNGDEVFP